MPLIPQLTPSKADLAREAAAVAAVMANPPGALFLGRPRGLKGDVAWRTDCAWWTAYPDAPPKIAAGDKAGAASWLRINAAIAARVYSITERPERKGWEKTAPTWPLPTAPTAVRAGSVFGAKRPWKGPQTRYHTGIDLTAAAGVPVLAPEAGVVVAPNSGWETTADGRGVKALIMTTTSGHTVLLGGIRPGSALVKAGQAVVAGQQLAEVGRYPGGSSMLHVNVYDRKMSEPEVNARKKWMLGAPQPAGLIDPAKYLADAQLNPKYAPPPAAFEEGEEAGLVDNDVEGGEVSEGVAPSVKVVAAGGRTGEKPCLIDLSCTVEDVSAWRAALQLYWEQANKALERAKGTGKPPTPEAGAAMASLTSVQQLLKNPPDIWYFESVDVHVDACRLCVESGAVLDAFAGKGSGSAKKKSSGLLIGVGVGLTLVGVGVAVAVSRRPTQKRLAS